MKSYTTNIFFSTTLLISAIVASVAGMPMNVALAAVPPAPEFTLPEIPTDTDTPVLLAEATTTDTVSKTVDETPTKIATTQQISSNRRSSGGGGGGGGGGSSRRSNSSSNKVTSTSPQQSATTVTTLTKCSGPTHPASEIDGSPTLAGLIDLFVALGIIPQDRAEKACAILISAETTTATAANTQAFTKTLSLGETHTDVTRLQQFLNAQGFTVATTGAGSKGQESDYYGVKTTLAVARFQEVYRGEILTPQGLRTVTGNFDQATMTKVNQLLGK